VNMIARSSLQDKIQLDHNSTSGTESSWPLGILILSIIGKDIQI